MAIKILHHSSELNQLYYCWSFEFALIQGVSRTLTMFNPSIVISEHITLIISSVVRFSFCLLANVSFWIFLSKFFENSCNWELQYYNQGPGITSEISYRIHFNTGTNISNNFATIATEQACWETRFMHFKYLKNQITAFKLNML